jgi:hypothetical protein
MTLQSIESTVAIMKDEIIRDIHSGLVPRSVRSFRELHEHTDPNCYGGFCEENGLLDALFAEYGVDADNWLAQAGIDYIDACQNAINDWLASAGHILDDMQDQTTASML